MIKLLKKLNRKAIIFCILSLIFTVFEVMFALAIPKYMTNITDIIQTYDSDLPKTLFVGLKMLLCAFGNLFFAIASTLIVSNIFNDFAAKLRSDLFKKVQSFSMVEIGFFTTTSLLTRSTNDVAQVQNFLVTCLMAVIKAPILITWAIIKMTDSQWQWSVIMAIALLVLVVALIYLLLVAEPKFKKLQTLTDNLNLNMRENISGIRVVRAYNAEHYHESKFDISNENLTNTNLFAMHAVAFFSPVLQLVISSASLAIYWIGALMINAVKLHSEKIIMFSQMMVFSQYAIQMLGSFMMFWVLSMIMPSALVSSRRILEVLETPISIKDGKILQCDPLHRGEIEFKNVSFRYPNTNVDVLSDISFSAQKGETVALIGSTGCGKTSIVNLIPRFYDVTKGKILVGGIDVREYKQDKLREMIGYVSQEAFLISGTIGENIAYGKDLNKESILNAIRIAQGNEIIEKSAEGIYSYVAQRGTNFSGGQKQRISIARAVYKNPEILIFDDSFSALDYMTDKKLRMELNKFFVDSTKIIVAQRIGTIMDADRIIVLDNGQIVGIGTHMDLMHNCEIYRQIAYSQLSKKELLS